MATSEILMWAIGIWITVSSGVIGHLYMSIGKVQEKVELSTANQLKEIWLAINQVKTAIDLDRQNTAENRVMIAKNMVTRDELDRQVERLISEINNKLGAARRGL